MLDCTTSEVSEANEMTFLRYEMRKGERVAVFNRKFEIDFIVGNGKQLIEGDASYDKTALKWRIANLERAEQDASVSKSVLERWPNK